MSEMIESSVRQAFPDAVLEAATASENVLTLKIAKDSIKSVCRHLKDTPGLEFNYPASITGVDWKDRFEVIYHLTSIPANRKVILKVDLHHDDPMIESVISVWKGADWQEREIYDLLGIKFMGHPDLRRILLPEDWEGYPLRKDYVIE